MGEIFFWVHGTWNVWEIKWKKKNDEISSGSEEEENIQNKTKNDDVLD